MINNLLSIIAPHHCYGCNKIGHLLCDNCKYNIINEPFLVCTSCGKPVGVKGVCGTCQLPYSRAWLVGERKDELAKVINAYKFERVKSAYHQLAELLAERMPKLPPETIIVPVPTIHSHIRQRGYDHTQLIARQLAKNLGLEYKHLLERQTNTKQRGANRSERFMQAKSAFALRGEISPTVTYLIVDDVVTTGATLKYASKILKDAGAHDVWVAVVAKSPLD